MIVGLPEMKEHLRVDSDDEDSTIMALTRAAEVQVRNWLDRPIYAGKADMPAPDEEGYDVAQIQADEAIKVAIKLLTDRLYNNRSGDGGSSDDAVPPLGVRALLAGHRLFAKGT